MKRSLYKRYGLGQKTVFDRIEDWFLLVVPYIAVFIMGVFCGLFWNFIWGRL